MTKWLRLSAPIASFVHPAPPKIGHWLPAALLAACLASPGCGGGGSSRQVIISITPSSANLGVGASQQFSAAVTGAGDSRVTWRVQEGTAGGSISGTGLYTAPGTAGTYHVVATSVAAPAQSAVVVVNVHVVVAITPAAVTLTLGQQQPFTATVSGTSNTQVIWSAEESNGGIVDAQGNYTAPGAPGVFHVVATSKADPSQAAAATVTVQAGSATGTIQ